MKTFILFAAFIFLLATSASAMSPEYEIDKYPSWIKNDCLELTATKTRISSKYNWDAALDCAERSWEKYQQERLLQSQINVNNAQADLDRELAKKIKQR